MQPSQYAKLEKTDILELAVIYLKRFAPRPHPNGKYLSTYLPIQPANFQVIIIMN